MTEEEAKTKWCPFVRAPHLGTAGINRQIDDQPTPQARCIGSACMAWQQTKAAFMGRRVVHNDGVEIREAEFGVPAEGRCGLVHP